MNANVKKGCTNSTKRKQKDAVSERWNVSSPRTSVKKKILKQTWSVFYL